MQADPKFAVVVLTEGETTALRAVLEDLAAMDTTGLPRDAQLATAAGPLQARTINRATWLHRRVRGKLDAY